MLRLAAITHLPPMPDNRVEALGLWETGDGSFQPSALRRRLTIDRANSLTELANRAGSRLLAGGL